MQLMAGRRAKEPEIEAEAKAARLRFGSNLEVAMGLKNMTPAKMGAALDCHPDTIYKYMAGKRDPELYVISRLARALGIEENELYPGSEKLRLIVGRKK